MFEINNTLPVEQTIRPTFSDMTFTANGDAPGNFSYCDMQDVTFINVEFTEWEASKLKGASFQNCIFGENTTCSASKFKKAKNVDSCTFELPVTELDELTGKLKGDSREEISQANMHVIQMKIKDTQKIQDLKTKLRSLQTGHQASSSSRFFDAPRDEILDSESRPATLHKY